MRRIGRAIAYILGLAALAALGSAHPSQAQGAQSRAGLVVQFGDGSVRSYCIAFEGESITGLDLLLKSGLNVTAEGFGGMGGLVCKIEGEGCDYPGEACVCKSYGPQGVYWSYHHLRQGKWKTSSMGAGGYRVRNGEVDGWAWSAGTAPVVRTFEQLCGGVQPAPTETQVPVTPTPRPRPPTRTANPPTATPRPTNTPIPVRATPQPVNSATIRVATSTPVPAVPQPTNTRQSPVIKPSPTTRRIVASATPTQRKSLATATLTPTERPIQPSPTASRPQATATATATRTASSTASVTVTASTTASTPTTTETPTAQHTKTTIPPVTATPTARTSATDTARTISMVIGAAAIGGLLVWGGVTLATRRPGRKSERR